MIKQDAKNLEEFVRNSYWENPEDAIEDIRKFITQNPIPQEILRIRDEWGSNWTDHAPYYIETLLNWIFKGEKGGEDEKNIL